MPKKFFLPLAVLLGASALLGGCGQKGPLYLPQDPAAPAPPQPTASTPLGVLPGTADPVYTEPQPVPAQTQQQEQERGAPTSSEPPDAPAEPDYEK